LLNKRLRWDWESKLYSDQYIFSLLSGGLVKLGQGGFYLQTTLSGKKTEIHPSKADTRVQKGGVGPRNLEVTS